MELRECLRVVRRSWIVIVATIVAAVATGVLVVMVAPPTYTAEAKIVVEANGTAGTAQEVAQASTVILQQLGTYVQLATTPLVLQSAIDTLALDTTPEELAEDVTTSILEETAVLSVTAEAPTALGSSDLANAIAESLIGVIGFPVNGVSAPTPVTGTIVQVAAPPTTPTTPDALLVMLVAFGAGAALAFVIVVFREVLNTRIRNTRDLERATELPILGTVSRNRGTSRDPLTFRSVPKSRFAESVRLIRTRIAQSLAGGGAVIAVTSAGDREGRTTISANLALAIAEDGRRVVLVDADLRAPGLARIFDITAEHGLLDVLEGRTSVDGLTVVEPLPNVEVVPTAQVATGGALPLDSRRLGAVIERLRTMTDVIVIDAGAAGSVADAGALTDVVDEFIVVVRARQTTRTALRAAVLNVAAPEGKVLGVVLNDVPLSGPDAD
ncbi:polysaccharide biosynthesis tyrosine autokinase [Agromyces binzhouensis]|uniref:polysaccharide biosynthesis tyrosine autokinase n=1 Tax=Agromyces binzhouensis TaxID=1817495 RepID=UPI003634D52D